MVLAAMAKVLRCRLRTSLFQIEYKKNNDSGLVSRARDLCELRLDVGPDLLGLRRQGRVAEQLVDTHLPRLDGVAGVGRGGVADAEEEHVEDELEPAALAEREREHEQLHGERKLEVRSEHGERLIVVLDKRVDLLNERRVRRVADGREQVAAREREHVEQREDRQGKKRKDVARRYQPEQGGHNVLEVVVADQHGSRRLRAAVRLVQDDGEARERGKETNAVREVGELRKAEEHERADRVQHNERVRNKPLELKRLRQSLKTGVAAGSGRLRSRLRASRRRRSASSGGFDGGRINHGLQCKVDNGQRNECQGLGSAEQLMFQGKAHAHYQREPFRRAAAGEHGVKKKK